MENNQQNQWDSGSWSRVFDQKSLFDLKKRDIIFTVCGLVISVFMAVYGIFGGFAFGYFLSAICLFTLFAVYFAKAGKLRMFPVTCGVLALANTAVFVTTTNGSVRFFGIIMILLLSVVCFEGIIHGTLSGNRRMLGVFYSAASTAGNISVSVKSLFLNGNGNKKVIGKVLIGVLCAIPVLVIVVPLLLSSDDAFRGMMDRMFANTGATVFKGIFGVVLSGFVIAYGFSLRTGRVVVLKKGTFTGVENVYILSFLSAISVCYLLYLFSQLAYFFSAFKGFLPDGEITYSKYARKGFFEMCVIAVINLVLVLAALLLAKKQNGKTCHGINLLATFIGVFTLIIIATSISKMVLYIDAYGMTVLRLTTSAFMVFLSVVFVSVILRVYMTKINIVKIALLTAGCIVLILGTVNVNSICAKYNYDSYCNGRLKTVDVNALYFLGDEGIPYITKLAESKEPSVAEEAKHYLAKAYLRDYYSNTSAVEGDFTVADLREREKNREISRFSLPRKKAYDSLYAYLEQHPKFSAQCEDYLNKDQ